MTAQKARSRFFWWWVTLMASALLVVGTWGWSEYRRAAVISQSVPKRPDLGAAAAELRERVKEANHRTINGPNREGAMVELAQLYQANGYLPEAQACLRCLLQIEPRNPRWKYRYALIISGFGEANRAVSLLRRTIELAPDYLPARLRLGDILLKNGRLKDAIAVFEAVQLREQDEPYSLLGLARCDMDQELWSEARQKLERVVAATDYALGYDLIVPVYEHLGMNDRAAAIRGRMKAWGAFRDVADPWIEELNSDSYDAFQMSVAAGALKVRGEKQGARQLLERAVRLSPRNATLHFQFALQLLDLSELGKARAELELCTQLEPTFADGWAYLSGVVSTTGDAAGAQRVFAQGLAQCPDSPGLHRMNAKQLQAQGRLDEAIKEYREAIRLRPTEADPHIELGMALYAANRAEEALKEFHLALEAEPENPLVLGTLAFNAITIGDEAAAGQWLRRIRNQPRVVAGDVEQLVSAFQQKFGHAP